MVAAWLKFHEGQAGGGRQLKTWGAAHHAWSTKKAVRADGF